jgi:hypothetical protein
VEVAFLEDRAVGNAIVGGQRTAACAHTRRASQRDGVRGGALVRTRFIPNGYAEA